jgi:hypothetical protein
MIVLKYPGESIGKILFCHGMDELADDYVPFFKEMHSGKNAWRLHFPYDLYLPTAPFGNLDWANA